MTVRLIIVAMALAACAPVTHPYHARDPVDAARVLAGGEAQIRSMLHGKVGYGGAYFADPACRKQFLVPRTIPDAELDAFAHCIAGLHLTPDTRTSTMPDFALVTYLPGIELEVRFVERPTGTQLVWIGYVGSADLHPTLPTITPAALEAKRRAGDAHPHVDDGELALFKLCIDGEGAVTGIHAILANSRYLSARLAAVLADWKFEPFELDGVASPVCSWIPVGGANLRERDEVPIAPLDPDTGIAVLRDRVSGEKNITPTDKDKLLIANAHVGTLVATVRYCVDADGTVSKVAVYTSSALPLYDEIIVGQIRRWKFAPGDAETCAAASLIYVQR